MELTRVAKFAPVDKVLVSASMGNSSKLDEMNSQILAKLVFDHHITAEKFTGEHHFNLSEMEERVVNKANGFLFMPIPDHQDHLSSRLAHEFYLEIFKIASLFVGVQTEDEKLRIEPKDSSSPLKPIVLVNYNRCYDPIIKLVKHLISTAVVAERYHDVLKPVSNTDDAIKVLKSAHMGKSAAEYHHFGHTAHADMDIPKEQDPDGLKKPDYNVCIFCSAGTKNKELLGIAEDAGYKLASKGWGVISGMGKTGMMGAVVKGAVMAKQETGKGWVGGSNLPRIIGMEGLPAGYDQLWLRSDIYQRMEVMIENSQAFLVMPGGMGTVQELTGMLLLKYNALHKNQEGQPYLMNDNKSTKKPGEKKYGNKPIILVNHKFREGPMKGQNFWQPIVDMARQLGFEQDIKVVEDINQAMKLLNAHHERGR